MKKFKLLLLLLFISPTLVCAETITGEYGNYDTAINIVKESMTAYYIKGPLIQYNYSKTSYPIGSPEEATSQDINYSVCAAYTYSVYTEAFGMYFKKDVSEFPRFNYDISNQASNYYNNYIKNNEGDDGHFLIYYQNKGSNIKYLYNDSDTTNHTGDLETLINNVKPGDLFVYSGHALIAYDVVINPNTGKKDVLILNSTADDYIRTRIAGTSILSYTMFKSPIGNNGILDVGAEGSVQFLWLSDSKRFNKNNQLNCQEEECAVIRPFYEKDGKAIFNYHIDPEKYSKGSLRTQYPGIYIEKTVNTGDNNSVNIGDELTYTIKVTNKSGVDYNPISYDAFVIEETIDNKVEYVSSNGEYNNNTIKWNINSLAPNESVELTYKVKVKEDEKNIFETIKSEGKFYSQNDSEVFLTTGTVKNFINLKTPEISNSYSTCYNENKTKYNGLELIDKIYSCVYPNKENLNLSKKFSFDYMFTKTVGNSPKSTSKIAFRSEEINNNTTFSKMILNDYFNGIIKHTDNKYYLPRFDSSPRAKTINVNDFKDGDVLIYYITESQFTNEEGLYAYIYIDGKFVGINGTDNTLRNEFTYNYYGQSYSKHIDESICNKYNLSASATCDYFYNLYGGYTKLNSTNEEEILNFVNYQTLMDKDYYVILRPAPWLIDKSSNPDTGVNFKYGILMILTSISILLFLLIRKKSKFLKHN